MLSDLKSELYLMSRHENWVKRVTRRRQVVEMITAEKARQAGMTGAMRQDIQAHIE